MTFRPLRLLRHLIAALLLLMAAAIGGEVYLRTYRPPAPACICSRAVCATQSLLQPSATVHHELRRTASGTLQTDGRRTSIRTNSFGLRGAEPRVPAAAGVYRILLLGDDTVCGSDSAEDRTLPALLQRLLSGRSQQPIEVLNAGVPGDCPLLSLLRYEQELFRLQPDLVILHFDMSDVADDIFYRRFLTVRDGLRQCPHPSLQPAATPPAASSVVQALKQSATAAWLLTCSQLCSTRITDSHLSACGPEATFAWITDHPPDMRIQVRLALEPLAALQQSVQQHGGRLLVTTCPVVWQVVPADGFRELTARCRMTGSTPCHSQLPFDVLRQYCELNGIAFTDSTDAFRRFDAPERLFATSQPVPSTYGAAVYAREIAADLLTSLGNTQ